MFSFFSKSIVRLFIFIIFLFIVIGFAVFAGIIGYQNYNKTLKDIQNKSSSITQLVSIGMREPLWTLDEEAIDSMIKAILSEDDIVGIQVYSWADKEKPYREYKSRIVHNLNFKQMKKHRLLLFSTAKVMKGEEKMGEVHIVLSKLGAQKIIRNMFELIGIIALSIILVISLIIYISGKKVIEKPIASLKKSANQLAEGKLETEIDTSRKDEIGSLGQSFSRMRDAIKLRISDLEILHRTSDKIAIIHDKQKAMEIIIDVFLKKNNFECGSLFEVDDKNDFVKSCTYPQDLEDLNPSLIDTILAQKNIIFIPNSVANFDKMNVFQSIKEKALLFIPLIDENKITGILFFIGSPNKVTFTSFDHNFALTVAKMTVVKLHNIHMIHLIEEHNRTLELKVQERTRDIKNLLDFAGQGFFSFNPNFMIHKEFSRECEAIFGKNINKIDISDLLFKNQEKKSLYKQAFDLYFTGQTDVEVIFKLLDKEFMINKKNVQIEYKAIDKEKVMGILTDITEKRKLEAKIEAENQKNSRLLRIMANNKYFGKFIEDNDKLFSYLKKTKSKQKLSVAELETLAREVHTFKGSLGFFNLVSTGNLVHNFESYLMNPSESNIAKIKKSIDEIFESYEREMLEIEEAIGKKMIDSFNSYVISKSNYKNLVSLVNKKYSKANDLLDLVSGIAKTSIKELFNRFPIMIQELAVKRGKKINPLVLKGGEKLIDADKYALLLNSFDHIIRNLVDHGIEKPNDRIEAKKSELGNITISFDESAKEYNFVFEDDGTGIDTEKVRKIAAENKLISSKQKLSDDELNEFIFSQNVSTSTKVTETSGRGVGLSYVKSMVEKFKGTILVESKRHIGSKFIIKFPK